jgi:hypothetical protein
MNDIKTYQAMKKIIEAGGYDKAKEMKKLTLFLALNTITLEQFEELKALVD